MDYIDSEGGIDGASGPVELPPDADRPDAEIQYDDDDDIQAIQSESDNYLIDQSEEACRKVGKKYINDNFIGVNNVQDKEEYTVSPVREYTRTHPRFLWLHRHGPVSKPAAAGHLHA
jgi:hypothetical protein